MIDFTKPLEVRFDNDTWLPATLITTLNKKVSTDEYSTQYVLKYTTKDSEESLATVGVLTSWVRNVPQQWHYKKWHWIIIDHSGETRLSYKSFDTEKKARAANLYNDIVVLVEHHGEIPS